MSLENSWTNDRGSARVWQDFAPIAVKVNRMDEGTGVGLLLRCRLPWLNTLTPRARSTAIQVVGGDSTA